MNAIVSGRSGTALLVDGESLKSFDLDDPATIVPRHRSELPYLFGEAADLRTIENTTIEAVERELRTDCHFTWALDLALISLDSELEDDIRTDALEDLEGLLTETTILSRLENVLYSRPVPESADLAGALGLCDPKLSAAFEFLKRLEERQPSIEKVSHAWEIIPTKIFGDHENREAFRHVAVKEGLFYSLATVDLTGSISTFHLKAGLSAAIQKLPNYRQVLQAWTKPFRQSPETPNIVVEDEVETISEQRLGKRARIDRRAVLREAVKKKSAIVAAMRRRDLVRVADLLDDLVAYQQRNSESQHTAKSLCDLAMEAKALEMSSLQLELTERSIGVAPGDSWSWAQYGDALLRVGRLDGAMKAYEQADAFGGGVVAKNGRAEVLKAQGQLAAALTAYEEVIKEYPEDVVAKNGRAEVLKTQAQLAAALTAYEEVIKEHPENAVAKNGRAEVLKALGQLPAALTAYEEVIKEHPENVVAGTGRAEVLKALGQLPAALTAYEEVIKQHPENVVAKTGRAEVLKAVGQLAAALTAYEEVIKEHPENVVAKTGRAEVLKTQGQFPAALTAYEEVTKEHPENVVAKTGRAEVLKAQGQLAAALTAYEEAIRDHPADVVAKNGRAEVLKALGQLPAALTAYEEAIREHPEDAVAKNGRSCVLLELNRHQEALESLSIAEPVTIEDWIGYHIRGMILLRLGRMSEAIGVFNHGLQNSPFISTKDYFKGALALSWLRGRKYKEAEEVLDAVNSPLLQPSANVIRIHVFGAQGNPERARQAYERLEATPHLLTDELTQELHHQYILREKPTKDEEWVFEREVRVLLRAA